MRLSATLRFIFCCAFVALSALASLAYGASSQAPASATKPLAPAPGTPTATVNPSQAVDLQSDGSPNYGDPGTTQTSNFVINNNNATTGNQCTANQYNVVVTVNNMTPIYPSPITANPVGSFSVQFPIPANASPGDRYDATITVTCTSNSNVSDREFVSVIVTASGNTITPTLSPTATGTPTTTPTPSSTVGTATPTCRDVYEYDDVLERAREIKIAIPQTHVICPVNDEDWIKFGGVAGKVYTIDVPTMAAGLDLSLGLYDIEGNLLAFNDDYFNRNPSSPDPTDIKPRIQSWRSPADATYFIRVRDAASTGGRELAYTISLIDESYGPTPTQVNEICRDLYEEDGLPEQARLLVVRETQKNHRLCPAGDADWFRMFMKVGARYRISTRSTGVVGADPVMVLADRDATTILDFNDDANGTLDPQIEYSPEVDGYYYIQIKNVGDVGNQFIAYDITFDQIGVGGGVTPTSVTGITPTTGGTTTTPAVTGTPATATATVTGTPPTATATPTGTRTTTPTATAYSGPVNNPASIPGVKGAPPFVNGPAKQFVDPSFANVWTRTDQVVANQQVQRTWMWGPTGLIARAELYRQANGGARQVQYFDKARMEITDWSRDRNNPWFVTNGLLVQELVDGRMQIGDSEFSALGPAQVNVAGDEGDANGPTYASFGKLLGRVGDRSGQIANQTLRRDGSTGTTGDQEAAKLVHYVTETGHNIPSVFWQFLQQRGPVGDGSRQDLLVDWVFAMGYPISEPYWTKVKVGGQERDVLVQAFQRRVLTYTPGNAPAWQVEMGNVGRHYYQWRYHVRP